MRALKNGKIVGLAIDQNNPKGIEVVFMGHKARMVDSVSRLAKKTNATILPVFFDKIKFARYNINFLEPIEPADFEDIASLTQRQADVLGKYIYCHPDLWFWQHKRFKAFHKSIYER
jgi:KDO2-lipid IV(A) lauroyltransferase